MRMRTVTLTLFLFISLWILPGSALSKPVWQILDSQTTVPLYALWGSGTDNVYAVGRDGTILRFNGTDWSHITPATTNSLYALHGRNANDIYAVGQNGTTLHYDGLYWNPETSGTTADLQAVWCSDSNTVFAAGHIFESGIWQPTLLQKTSGGWVQENITVSTSTFSQSIKESIYGLWGTGDNAMYAVGRRGLLITGSPFDSGVRPTDADLYAIWGSTAGTIFAVGAGGTLCRFDGSQWLEFGSDVTGTGSPLYSIWGQGSNEFFAVGFAGTIIHHNAAEKIRNLINPANYTLNAVWGVADQVVFAAGDGGTIIRLSIDPDGDRTISKDDNCPEKFNPRQLDFDQDNIGNVCDNDPPYVSINLTPCPSISRCATPTYEELVDSDGDDIPDEKDDCPDVNDPTNRCAITFAEEIILSAVRRPGLVTVNWTAISEDNVLGYRILRSRGSTGDFAEITDSLIPAKGTIEITTTYSFEDRTAKPGRLYRYKLIEIGTDGSAREHGPVMPTRAALLNLQKH